MNAQKCAFITISATFGTHAEREVRPQMKLSVLLSDDEGERFCVYCAEKGHKKSTLIARLIREHLDREAFSTQRSLFPQRESAMPKERPVRKTKVE